MIDMGNLFDAKQSTEKSGYESLGDAAKKFDAWAIENPYQAAALGAAVGLATSIAFNKILMIKGAVAIGSCVYGTVKGAASGYAYPTVRAYTLNGFANAADNLTKIKEMAEGAYKETTAHAEEVYQGTRGMFRQAVQAAKATFG